MATIPQTGLTMLGEAISGGARDYANRRMSLEDEARRRAQQLDDVAAARAYDQQTYGRRRADQLEDVGSARAYEGERFRTQLDVQTAQAIALGLVHEGILAPGDLNKPEAVAAAFEVARTRGLDKLYSDLLTTPDANGRPLLDRSQLNNPSAIEAAKSALAQTKAGAMRLQMDQPANAADAIGDLSRESAQVRQQLAAVEQRLSAPAPQPDPSAIQGRALQLAREAKGGGVPSQQEIQAMIPQAQQEASQLTLQQWYQDKEDAKIQYQILNARLNNLRAAQSDLTRTFQVAPRPTTLQEPAAAAPAPQASTQATAEQRTAALAAAVRAAAGTPEGAPVAAPGQAELLVNPVNDPLIAQENQRREQQNLSSQNRALADPYNEAIDELSVIDAQIAGVRAGQRQGLYQGGITAGPYAGAAVANPLTGAEQAATLSDLLIKQQAVQRNLEQRRRAMLGLPAEVTAPVVSNAAGSTPAEFSKPDNWWRQ
jgi:hypothetical protein